MSKNLLSVSQLTASGNCVVSQPGTPTMEGQRLESVYGMSAESAYLDKTRRNEKSDLWHAHLGHVSYHSSR